jgi:hypothetical protein
VGIDLLEDVDGSVRCGDLQPGSPAEKAGFQRGDTLVGFTPPPTICALADWVNLFLFFMISCALQISTLQCRIHMNMPLTHLSVYWLISGVYVCICCVQVSVDGVSLGPNAKKQSSSSSQPSSEALTLDEVASLLRGPPGEPVGVVVRRGSEVRL